MYNDKDSESKFVGYFFAIVAIMILNCMLCIRAYSRYLNPGETFNLSIHCGNCPDSPSCDSCCKACPSLAVGLPVATPKPAPIPTPALTQPVSPNGQTVDLTCTVYPYGKPWNATASQKAAVDKIKQNCTNVLTWWPWKANDSWCPYVLTPPTKVKNCGIYQNYGYTSNRKVLNAWDAGGDWFNQYVKPNHPEYILRG